MVERDKDNTNIRVMIAGAGNVGATLALRVVEDGLADVVLLDIEKDLARGKALDLMHAASIIGHDKEIMGTDDYKEAGGSDIAVITAGFPRQPGMARADLIKKNGGVVKNVVNNIRAVCPDAIIIVVTNPLDTMTYLALRESGFGKNRVMGMAGALDTSRFVHIISRRLRAKHRDIETIVLGQHGPEMVPLISQTKIFGKPLTGLAGQEVIEGLTEELCEAGGRIVGLLGKGSAYYAPSAAAFSMVKAIINDEKKLLSVSCLAEGEYGIEDVCIGLPVRLGRGGIEEIVQLNLTTCEAEALKKSAEGIKKLAAGL